MHAVGDSIGPASVLTACREWSLALPILVSTLRSGSYGSFFGRQSRVLGMFILTFVVLCCGCGGDRSADETGDSPSVSPKATGTALEAAGMAANEKRWGDAKALIRDALIEEGRDPRTLQLAAEIAFATGDSDAGMVYLVDASVADEYRDEALVQEVTMRLISLGRIYEAIDFLGDVVEAHPERHATRRNLFDFLVNVEEKYRAIPHGRELVRQRQFDLVLLYSLATLEQRDMETDSMATLSQINPEDLRLKLAGVREQFDQGDWDQAEAVLKEILLQTPGNTPAQILLGQFYVESGQVDQLPTWSQLVTPATTETWQYWDILGDWATAREQHAEAARAYWESTRRNLDVGDVFAKLATTLAMLKESGEDVDDGAIDACDQRAQLIGRFLHDKDRFYKQGNRSNAIAADVARSLLSLGRYWEAEAWVAIALTMPDEDVEQAVAARQQILSRLRNDTPWQVADGHPGVKLDLSDFPSPELARLAAPSGRDENTKAFRPSIVPRLENQAVERGLVSWEDRQPKAVNEIIPMYKQMESGGGSIDFDLDGWPDLYIGDSSGFPGARDSNSNQLFRNRSGQFNDVTQHAGVIDKGFAQGITVAM